jgi:acyl-CoA hydrolase
MATVSETRIENHERVQPNDTNNYSSAHGGKVVKWMDEVGAMSAMRHAGTTCVTARINQLDFRRPIPQGNICVIEAYAYKTGRSSIRVRITASREAPRTGEREQTTDSYFVYVAVDENSEPKQIAPLDVTSSQDRDLRQAALDGETDG